MKEIDYKIVCYYTNWYNLKLIFLNCFELFFYILFNKRAQYRPEPTRFTPDSINPNLCTHIIFAFAKIDENYKLASYEWNDDVPNGMYQQVIALKSKNPKLKVLLAVGGWNHGSLLFSNMARNDDLRKTFVESSVNYLLDRDFDGLGKKNIFKNTAFVTFYLRFR
jgi:chitinase